MQMNAPKGRALQVQKQFNCKRNLEDHLKYKIEVYVCSKFIFLYNYLSEPHV